MADPQKIIVKVQIAEFPPNKEKTDMLVYNEDRSFAGSVPYDATFDQACMKGRTKAFFYANLYHTTHEWSLTDNEAPWQEW